MFASIRCYVVRNAPTEELAGLVEAEFADQIAAQPGFVWYALLDCGGGDLITVSVFRERDQAAGSRELAQRWTAVRLSEFDLTLTEAVNGAIPVSRAAPGLLEPASARFARVRRYQLGVGELGEVIWRIVDTRLAERMAQRDGFKAYFVLGSRTGELVSVSVFRDRGTASASDEVALAFVRDELDSLEIERTGRDRWRRDRGQPGHRGSARPDSRLSRDPRRGARVLDPAQRNACHVNPVLPPPPLSV